MIIWWWCTDVMTTTRVCSVTWYDVTSQHTKRQHMKNIDMDMTLNISMRLTSHSNSYYRMMKLTQSRGCLSTQPAERDTSRPLDCTTRYDLDKSCQAPSVNYPWLGQSFKLDHNEVRMGAACVHAFMCTCIYLCSITSFFLNSDLATNVQIHPNVS